MSSVVGWVASHAELVRYAVVVAALLVAAEVVLRLRSRAISRKCGSPKERELRFDGYVVIPFTKVRLRCCEEGVVTATPPPGVRLCYLVVPRLAAMDMEIVSLRVGPNSMFASEGAVPADVFAGSLHLWGFPGEYDRVRSVALDFPVPLALEDPDGRAVELKVCNVGSQVRDFTAVMFGKRISARRI